MTDPTGAVDRIAVGGTYGLIAALVFGIIFLFISFQKRYIVQGWLYGEVQKQRDSWQEIAENQGDKIERLTTLAETQQRQMDDQKATISKLTDRLEVQTRLTEANGAKLDRALVALEARRTTR